MTWLPPPPRGGRPARSTRGKLLGGGGGGFGLLIAIAYLVVHLLAPKPPAPVCAPGAPCGAPPQSSELLHEAMWTSPDLGYQLSYDPAVWSIQSQDGSSLRLSSNDVGGAWLWVQAVPASNSDPDQLVASRAKDLGDGIVGLSPDDLPTDVLLGPAVGYTRGVGGLYFGQVDAPQGPGGSLTIAIMAATDGQVSAVVSVVSDDADVADAFQEADSVLNSFRWPSEAR